MRMPKDTRWSEDGEWKKFLVCSVPHTQFLLFSYFSFIVFIPRHDSGNAWIVAKSVLYIFICIYGVHLQIAYMYKLPWIHIERIFISSTALKECLYLSFACPNGSHLTLVLADISKRYRIMFTWLILKAREAFGIRRREALQNCTFLVTNHLLCISYNCLAELMQTICFCSCSF